MTKRKLIEVAIPLDAINAACKADKDRKTGTIRNLHKWFAPMPLPAWRALLFATLVDAPEEGEERDRLLRLTEALVESGADLPPEAILQSAREEIQRCWPQGVPPVLDPFCGGGSTLVEAQRLGCESIGSDLNPIPVLISTVLTELLPKTSGQPALHEPVGALPTGDFAHSGIVEDVSYYARAVEARVRSEMDACYPAPAPNRETLLWLWCRSAKCPNPACGVETPLTTSWVVSKRKGDEQWVVPLVRDGRVRFVVEGPVGEPPPSPKVGRGATFTCVACGATIDEAYLMRLGKDRGLGLRLIGAVDVTPDGRRFRCATDEEEAAALAVVAPEGAADAPLPTNTQYSSPPLFGLSTHASLYTTRQLRLLASFASAVDAITEDVRADGGDETRVLTVAAILGLAVGKLAQYASSQSLIRLRDSGTKAESGFTRGDFPMTWDFCEINPFASVGASWQQMVTTALRAAVYAPTGHGVVTQGDARVAADDVKQPVVVATDPPYFGHIPYAELSDYFYVWLRPALRNAFPDLFATRAAPKQGELVALTTSHGGSKEDAKQYFVDGFTATFKGLGAAQSPEAPMLVVYAYKEQNARLDGGGVAPGWEAILEAMIAAGLMVVGTWPVRGTGSTRMRAMASNTLATYVVLVCRPRPSEAPRVTRSDLTRSLRTELASAVAALQHAAIAPVDLAQAVIGPGMEIFSRCSSVVETDGTRVGVAEALALINRTLGEILDEQEGDLDPDSRWAITWYEQYGFEQAPFGEADQLARAKGIAVDDLVRAGIVTSGGNKVALLERGALREGWDPVTDHRATAWEAVQYLARALMEGGEAAAADLYSRLGMLSDPARELAYRLFQIAERRGSSDEAVAYNSVVVSWSEMARLAEALPATTTSTESLF